MRRYLKRAPKGYITEGGTYSQINSSLTETVEGARTVEALGLQADRVETGDDDIARVGAGRALHDDPAQHAVRRDRVRLRHPAGDGADLGRRRLHATAGSRSGQITAATLYVQALVEPLSTG